MMCKPTPTYTCTGCGETMTYDPPRKYKACNGGEIIINPLPPKKTKKVYILERWSEDETAIEYVYGVYKTKKLAKQARKESTIEDHLYITIQMVHQV